MQNNLLPLIEKYDNTLKEDLISYYRKVFGSVEGELVLMDLMMNFYEFKPTSTAFEAGGQSVLIYIKNRILGIIEQPITKQGEMNHEPAN